MKKVESFNFTYRPQDDAGTITLALEGGVPGSIMVDSPAEAHFLLYLLKNDDSVYFDPGNGLISTGIEYPGGGEEADD